MITEFADQITYTKGPYYADVGDFGAVGSDRISYRNSIPDQVIAGVGTYGYERLLGGQRRCRSAISVCSRPSSCSTTTAHG
jgi:hypothetical protein